MGDASLHTPIEGTPPLWGTAALFDDAARVLIASTRKRLELAGAARSEDRGGEIVLHGLEQRLEGEPDHVGIERAWGTLLWHTHPGLRLSMAEFSRPDLRAARDLAPSRLLVIGYTGLAPEYLALLTMPLGMRMALAGGGLRLALELERRGILDARLLSYGVAVRVCHPGRDTPFVAPVRRWDAGPVRQVVDELQFRVDHALAGANRALLDAGEHVFGPEWELRATRAVRDWQQRAVDAVRRR